MNLYVHEHTIGDLCKLVTLAWDGGLVAASFSRGSALRTLRERWEPGYRKLERPHDIQHQLDAQITKYIAGDLASFNVPLDLDGLPEFTTAVLQGCAQIPMGQLMTYGDLAARAGSPSGARAVGQVMNRNPFALIVPCHRVVASGGRLGGFAPGTALKRRLLGHEGHQTTADRVIPIST